MLVFANFCYLFLNTTGKHFTKLYKKLYDIGKKVSEIMVTFSAGSLLSDQLINLPKAVRSCKDKLKKLHLPSSWATKTVKLRNFCPAPGDFFESDCDSCVSGQGMTCNSLV